MYNLVIQHLKYIVKWLPDEPSKPSVTIQSHSSNIDSIPLYYILPPCDLIILYMLILFTYFLQPFTLSQFLRVK